MYCPTHSFLDSVPQEALGCFKKTPFIFVLVWVQPIGGVLYVTRAGISVRRVSLGYLSLQDSLCRTFYKRSPSCFTTYLLQLYCFFALSGFWNSSLPFTTASFHPGYISCDNNQLPTAYISRVICSSCWFLLTLIIFLCFILITHFERTQCFLLGPWWLKQ